MELTVYGSNWEELTGKQIDILIDGEYKHHTTVQQETYPYARYTYTATTPGQHTITFQINDTQYRRKLHIQRNSNPVPKKKQDSPRDCGSQTMTLSPGENGKTWE